jgi:hypothetical protein
METSSIELWRVGSVVCYWSADFRQVRVLRNGELLSDQTFPYPADALEAAREIRQYFQLMAEIEGGQTLKASVPSRGTRSGLRAVPAQR